MEGRRVIHPDLFRAFGEADKDKLVEDRIRNLNRYLVEMYACEELFAYAQRFGFKIPFGEFPAFREPARYDGLRIRPVADSDRLLTAYEGLPERAWNLHLVYEKHDRPLIFMSSEQTKNQHGSWAYEYPEGVVAYEHNYGGMRVMRPVAELMNACHIISAGLLRDSLEHQIRLIVNRVEER